ncbi:MAG: glycosyltransferase [Pseudomonadota bacterium]
MKVMIVVTHLLGTGHLARALTLGRAFGAAGHKVTVVSGGALVPHFETGGLDFVQLPVLRANGTDFTTLLGSSGTPVSARYLEARQEKLLATLNACAPDVIITELFPFGRRILRAEFRALLGAADARPVRPLILSSIRDILAPPSKPEKAVFADILVAQYYDGVLVHADADLVRLERSWPVSDTLAPALHYTGFVAPPAPTETGADTGLILVSAGGGSVGMRMFEAAMDAAYLMADDRWLFLVGGDDDRRLQLAAKVPPHVRVEPPRPDFRTLLMGASASVSMCGYNTALDVLQTGVPSVFVPFDDGGEVEQGLRAEALAALNGIRVLEQARLSGPALAKALEAVRGQSARPARRVGMNGAGRTVEITEALHARMRP